MRHTLRYPEVGHYVWDTENGKYISKENKGIKRESHIYYVYSKDLFRWKMNKILNYELRVLYLMDNGEIYYAGDSMEIFTFEEIKEKFKSGELTTELPEGVSLRIFNMGVYVIDKNKGKTGEFNCKHMNFMESGELLKEIQERIDMTRGELSTAQKCHNAFGKWSKAKTEENRKSLQLAYEKVPGHNRCYILGDQDLKDIPIRMAIYGEQEKEGWTHRAVGKILKGKGVVDEVPDIKL